VEASGTIGKDGLALGGEVAFDPELGRFTKYNAAIGITKKDFNASLTLYVYSLSNKFSQSIFFFI
jgi:voltage-dependent anion channel protein 2